MIDVLVAGWGRSVSQTVVERSLPVLSGRRASRLVETGTPCSLACKERERERERERASENDLIHYNQLIFINQIYII